MLEKIELRNWKTHKATALSFSKGANILVGQMGAGKSSVLDAIAYALFGKYPALQHRRTSITDVITNRPEQMQEASVTLVFDAEGNEYEVTRNISLNGDTKAVLKKNGSYAQSQPQRVNEEIEKLLKIDYDLFMRAIYAEQNNLTYFLELSPSQRKKEIDELLGLNLFATAQDNATTLTNKIKEMIEQASITAKGFDIDKLKKQLEDAEKSKENLEKEKLAKIDEIQKKEAAASALEKQLEEAKKKLDEKQKLDNEIAQLKAQMALLEKEISKIAEKSKISKEELEKQIESKKENVEKTEKELNDANKAAKEAVAEIAKKKAELSQIEKEAEELEQIKREMAGRTSEELKKQVEKDKASLSSLQEERAAYASAKAENEKWLAELKKHIAKCPVCERELTEEMIDALQKSKEAAIKELDEKLEKTSRQMEDLKKSISKEEDEQNKLIRNEQRQKELEQNAGRLEKERSEIAGLEKRQKELEQNAEEKRKQLQKETEELNKLNSLHDELERKERHEKEIVQAKNEAERKEKEAATIDIDEKKVEQLQKGYVAISSELSSAKASLSSINRLLESAQAQIDSLNENLNAIKKIYEDIEAKKRIVNELVKYKNALAETQEELRSQLVSYINKTMQILWPELYPYADYSGIKLEPTSDDYVLMLKTNRHGSEWEPVESVASGGERSIACLAMRVAFALVLVPNLKWLILDEPTHNIDQQGIQKFVKAVSEALPKYVEQIFIITHDELLRQAQNARIYVFTRDKAANGETQVQEA
ncbi:MAG: ATP-binding protein [Candidatus Micrarchaeia archaeon]